MRKNFITIGTFDGVHTGHKYLISVLKDLAAGHKMSSAVCFFAFPPKAVIKGEDSLTVLTTPAEKLELLRGLGADEVIKLDFKDIRNLTAREFFESLIKKYNMGGILAGPDFAFGRDRAGNAEFLRKACAENNIICVQTDFIREGGHKVSSSRIRQALKDGDIKAAALMLGRPYSLEGKIVKGRQLGRTIGFPTANMDADPSKIMPRGVFGVKVFLGDEVFDGVCNIGLRPTVSQNGIPSVEVHILDFDRDIYGRNLKIDFIDKIRDEVKFDSIDKLKEQIRTDSGRARNILK